MQVVWPAVNVSFSLLLWTGVVVRSVGGGKWRGHGRISAAAEAAGSLSPPRFLVWTILLVSLFALNAPLSLPLLFLHVFMFPSYIHLDTSPEGCAGPLLFDISWALAAALPELCILAVYRRPYRL